MTPCTLSLRRSGLPPAVESPLTPDRLADLAALAHQREERRQSDRCDWLATRRRNWRTSGRAEGSRWPFGFTQPAENQFAP